MNRFSYRRFILASRSVESYGSIQAFAVRLPIHHTAFDSLSRCLLRKSFEKNLHSWSRFSSPSADLRYATIIAGSVRLFSDHQNLLPDIKDSDIKSALKDLMAGSWDTLSDPVIYYTKLALSKKTDDVAGKEMLLNTFRAAEAVEEFGGILNTLKMELDDSIGLSGEDVKPLPEKLVNALRLVFQRYITYLDAFTPDENYLKRKVETELGSKMIYLKMRCGGIGSDWGKVSVLGTSGLAGSYIEQRA